MGGLTLLAVGWFSLFSEGSMLSNVASFLEISEGLKGGTLETGRSELLPYSWKAGLSGKSGLGTVLPPGDFSGRSGLAGSATSSFMSLTKLSGKTPTLPLSSPFHQPLSSTSLVSTTITSPSRIVSSSSFWAS
uniref:Putative secreted protein n=1 Tax=Ixodes ricinus TaxID=34613 RepID=A0A6B0US35_IXORI